MAMTSLAQGMLRAPAMALMIASASLVLGACGGGKADAPKSQAAPSESTGTDTGNDTGNQQPTPRSLRLTSQPSSATVYEGQSATFTLGVSHTYPVTISWFRNGTKITGASGTSYTVSASTGNAGTYTCSVTDGVLTENCNSFSLTVNQIVRITQQPSNQMVSEGADVNLSVTATGTGPLSYQWYFNSQPLSGKTSAQLALDDVDATDTGSYHCVVRNGGSTATSNSASVSVVANAVTGAAQITWSRPTQRANGTALSANEINGYRLYYGASASGPLSLMTTLTAAELSIRVDDLVSGTHYFALTTVDANGLESAQSDRFSVIIN